MKEKILKKVAKKKQISNALAAHEKSFCDTHRSL